MGKTRSGLNYGSYYGIASRAVRYGRSLYGRYKSRGRRVVGRRVGNKFKFRGFGSRTGTMRKRKSNIIKSGTAGISGSGCKDYRKCYPSCRTILRASQLSTYKITDTARVEWDAGAQSVTGYSVGRCDDVGLLFVNIGASATGQSTTRMVVKCMKMRLTFTNQSNANAMVTLYDIEYRHDTYANMDAVSPVSAWGSGIQREEEGGDSPGYANVGATPFQSSDFCRYYRVRKVTKVYLDPGKSHVHSYTKMAYKMLNNGLNDDSVNMYGIRGFTHEVVMVCQGMPVNDGTTDTLIAYGSGAVDVVVDKTYEQCWPQYGLRRYYYDNNQGTITTEKIINDETNAPDTYAEV